MKVSPEPLYTPVVNTGFLVYDSLVGITDSAVLLGL